MIAPGALFEGRYRVERELGRGGMAAVWLAEDTKHGRRVAIKVIAPEAASAIGEERFRREIAILARLQHPHVVPLHDSGATDGVLWYVMPHVEGESLRARLARETRLPLEEAVRLTREIASGLGHAHRQGLVHRDMKPENVLLSQGIAMVADFGIASDTSGDDATRPGTAPGFAAGTPRYMAPEQFAGGSVDARTDLYALGCVLYEMVAGAPPFDGPPETLARAHLTETPRPQPPLADFLARALAKAKDERFRTAAQFVEALVAATSGASAARGGDLPRSRHRFIGRADELAACRAQLGEGRLLTLIGVGGTGKTRLALALAEEHAARAPVFWADLAPAVGGARMIETVAHAVGVREAADRELLELVRERLSARGSWLVLDNCETALAAAAALADALLSGGDEPTILATGREPLGVAGERLHTLKPLAVANATERVADSDAGRFFVDRLRAVNPDFAVTPANAATVLEICRRLDGIPLALDLAAARTRVLSLEQVRDRLGDRFRLLAGRTNALETTIRWSYDQLDPDAQALFRALSVFAGGWTLEAAQAVRPGRDEFALIDALAQLVDKSLVFLVHGDGEPRYGMLETLREFARDRAAEAGETEALRDHHAAAFTALAERAYRGRFDEDGAWDERLEADHDNLAAALDHLERTDSEAWLALAGALAWFWQERSHLKEGRAQVTAALAATPALPARPARARALWGAAMMLAWQGAPAEAKPLMEESLAMLRALDDPAEIALALEGMGWTRFVSGDDEGARAAFEEGLALQLKRGDPAMIARARAGLGQALVALHRTVEARALAEEIVADGAARRDRRNEHFGWHYLADCALIEGDCATSLGLYRRSLELAKGIGDRIEIGFEVQGVAMSLAGLGRAEEAVVLAAAVDAEFARLGAEVSVRFWNDLLERFLGPARGERTGPTLPLEVAVERALALDPGESAP